MTKLTKLTGILTLAVRRINAENGIKLKKILERGDHEKGYGLYRDSEYNEFRVVHVAEGEHLIRADYHTSDKDDAVATGGIFLKPVEQLGDIPDPITEEYLATGRLPGEGEPQAAEEARPLPTRPRGFYARPSKLLNGLLARAL